MKALRILMVHNYYKESGGEDLVFQSEVNLLRTSGHEVIEYNDSNKRIDQLGTIKTAINMIWSESSYKAIRKIINEKEPDIAHFHNTFLMVSPSAYYACWEAKIPVVQSLHNYRLSCPAATFLREGRICELCLKRKFAWPSIYYKCYHNSRPETAGIAVMLAFHRALNTWQSKVDSYIALTQFSRSKFIESGFDPQRIMVKPNFIEDPGWDQNKDSYAIFVGRFSQEKGIDVLLNAWRQLSGIPLILVGDGPLMSHIQETITTMNNTKIQLTGQISPDVVLKLIKSSKCLLLPSKCYEGFPRVVLEAFSVGTPVLASRIGSITEIVQEGKFGRLFNPGDSDDLAMKVRWLWENPDECSVMGINARKEYEAKYTPERNYEIQIGLYNKLLVERGKLPKDDQERGY